MKIVLAGYYGFRNIGDDLMLGNLVDLFRSEPQVERIDVFCREDYYPPREKVRYLPAGKRALPGRLAALSRADLVIWGGGTCLYESDHNGGLFWIYRLQQLARLCNARFAFAGIGVGNFRTEKLARLAATMLERADHVSFREEESPIAAKALGYRGAPCRGGDLVFLRTAPFEALRFEREREVPPKRISFSGLHGLDDRLAAHYAGELGALAAQPGAELHFLPAHAGAGGDGEFHERVARLLPREKVRLHTWHTPGDYLRVMAGMDFHIGMRLHSVICADLLGLPSLGISYAPKVRYYIEKSGVMAGLRVLDMGEPIGVARIGEIAAGYRRPEYFIAQESHKANKCIEKLFP